LLLIDIVSSLFKYQCGISDDEFASLSTVVTRENVYFKEENQQGQGR
jgi:hypothetical protein